MYQGCAKQWDQYPRLVSLDVPINPRQCQKLLYLHNCHASTRLDLRCQRTRIAMALGSGIQPLTSRKRAKPRSSGYNIFAAHVVKPSITFGKSKQRPRWSLGGRDGGSAASTWSGTHLLQTTQFDDRHSFGLSQRPSSPTRTYRSQRRGRFACDPVWSYVRQFFGSCFHWCSVGL